MIEVVAAIRALLPELEASLPADVDVKVLSDRTASIQSSVRDTEFELGLAIALVVMVIFLFLRTLSATVIPSLAVPVSLVGTFGVMYLAGFSINNLTLMALTIATGFVVDDAIVTIENIARHIEEGARAAHRGHRGSRQIASTIVSLTFSLVAVLIPLLFMGDVVGRLFREFAITLAVAILISALVSLTFTPMLCARLLKHVPVERQGRFQRPAGDAARPWLDRVVAVYARVSRLGARAAAGRARARRGDRGADLALAWWVPKGFFPVQDTGMIQAVTEAEGGVSFAAMSERQTALAEVGARRPGGRERRLDRRRGRCQRDAEHRALLDQPQAVRRAARGHGGSTWFGAFKPEPATSPASRSTRSRSKISRVDDRPGRGPVPVRGREPGRGGARTCGAGARWSSSESCPSSPT